MGVTILVAQPVSIFRAEFWQIVMKYEFVMFFNFYVVLKMYFFEVATFFLLILIQSTHFFSDSMYL